MTAGKHIVLDDILREAVDRSASDTHIMAFRKPIFRIDGVLVESERFEEIDPQKFQDTMFANLSDVQEQFLRTERELGYVHHLETGHRFRVNLFWERGHLAFAARLVPVIIPTMDEIDLPPIVRSFTKLDQGLILITGQTGHGKSTTLAAMVNAINKERSLNIITFEDPIEFVMQPVKSIIRQRELGSDITSMKDSLKYVVRHDPDVIVVGEMRDPETIGTTITLAETGHLVFSTLHTFDAPQTIHRILDSFPSEQQTQIRLQLAMTLRGIISQRLVKRAAGGRIAARELLINTPAVSNLIRENKIEQIATQLQTGNTHGMTTMDQCLRSLYEKAEITKEEALAHMLSPKDLERGKSQ